MSESTTSDGVVEVFCSSCRTSIVQIANRWWQVTKSHYTFLPQGTSPSDLQNGRAGLTVIDLPNLKIGEDEFHGSGELTSCMLRTLHCRGCGKRVGIECIKAPDSKSQHRDICFFKDSRIALRRLPSGDPVALNIVASTSSPAPDSSFLDQQSPSNVNGEDPKSTGVPKSIFETFDGTVSSTPEPKHPQSSRELRNDHQDISPLNTIEPEAGDLPRDPLDTNDGQQKTADPPRLSNGSTWRETSGSSVHDSELRSIITSQAVKIDEIMQTLAILQRDVGMMNSLITVSSSNSISSSRELKQTLEVLQKDVSTVKDFMNKDSPSPMMRPSILKRKQGRLNNGTIEISDDSRDSSHAREIGNARLVKHPKTTHHALEQSGPDVAAAMQRLRATNDDEGSSQLQHSTSGEMSRVVPSSIDFRARADQKLSNIDSLKASSRAPSNAMENDLRTGLKQHVTPAEHVKVSNPRIIASYTFPSNPSTQISRETQEELEKAVFDDPNDMDYMPSNLSASVSTANLPLNSTDAVTRNARDTEKSNRQPSGDSTQTASSKSDADRTLSTPRHAGVPPTAALERRGLLSSPAKPLQSLSGRGGRRPGAGRPRKNMAVNDGRETPPWERPDWDHDAWGEQIVDPAYKTKPTPRKAIARRGVSRGGMVRSPSTFVHAQSKYGTNQQVVTPRSAEKPRDAEGYILLPNGQRDGRSARWRKPTSSQGSQEKGNPENQDQQKDGDTIEVQGTIEKQGHQDGNMIEIRATAEPQSQAEQENHRKLMAKIFPRGYGGS